MASDALQLAILLSLKDEASQALGGIREKLGGVGTAAVAGLAIAGGAVVGLGTALLNCGKIAAEEEQGVARLGAVVKASGGNWDEASGAIETYLNAELRRVALDDGDGRASIARLTTATGSYQSALSAMPSVLDLAAGASISLEQATQLVARGMDGNLAGLSKLIPGLEKGASATEIFAAINSKFGGSAEAMANTYEGSQKKLNVAMEALQSTVGSAVLPVMTDFISTLAKLAMDNLPMLEAAIASLKVWVTETLIPILKSAYEYINDPLIPILKQVAQWLGQQLPGMISVLKTFCEQTLIPALRGVWAFINDPFVPILRTVGTWIGTNLPGVIETLKRAWETVLLPAITAIYNFISTYLVPILSGLWTWLGDKLPVVIQILSGLWTTVLQPALQVVSDFLGNQLIPALSTLWDWLGPKLQGVVTWFKDTGAPWLKGAFDVVLGPVKTLCDAIGRAIGLLRELTDMPVPDAGGGGGGGAGSGAASVVASLGAAAWSATGGVYALSAAMGELTGTGGMGGGYMPMGDLMQDVKTPGLKSNIIMLYLNKLRETIGGLEEANTTEWDIPIGPGGENRTNWVPVGPGGESPYPLTDSGAGASTPWSHTPIGPGGEYNPTAASTEKRGAMGIPWQEAWGPWPFGDFTNYDFNYQGYQQKYGNGPMGKTWYVRFAGWYKRGDQKPDYGNIWLGVPKKPTTPVAPTVPGEGAPEPGWIPIGPGGEYTVPPAWPGWPGDNPGEWPGVPETPGVPKLTPGTGQNEGDVGTGQTLPGYGLRQAVANYYTLQYNAYRQEPGYNDAAMMMRILELYARLHG